MTKKFTFLILFFVWNKSLSQVVINYTYDKANRLTKTTYGDGKQVLYTYDKLGNRQSMIILIPCQNPDLVVSDVSISKYTPDKIYYALQIKNQGLTTANMGSFAFAAFNSTDATRDASDEFRSALFTGGSLAPNATMTINYSSGFNFNNTKYYLILTADYYGVITECVETNNDLAKLVNPCSSNANMTVTGIQSNKLISSNGTVTIQNATLNNVLVVGKSVTQLPSATMQNSSVSIGGCLNLPVAAPIQSENPIVKSSLTNLQFEQNELIFNSESSQKLTFSVFGDTEKKLIDTYFENQTFESGSQTINIDTSKWIKGQKYALHLGNSEHTEVIIVEW